MVAGRERSAEGRARLSVGHETVGEEDAVLGSEPVGDLACLAYEAVLQFHAVEDGTAVVDDGVLTDDARPYIHAGLRDALDGAVAQAARSVHLTVIIDVGVGDLTGVDHLDAVADGASVGDAGLHLLTDKVEDGLHELLVAVVVHHEGGELTGESVEEHDVAIAHLIKYGDEVAFSKSGSLCGLDGVDIADVALVAYGIVVDEVADILDEAVVADGDVTQSGALDAAVLDKAFADFYLFSESTDAHLSIE